jgi:hypothetical protein
MPYRIHTTMNGSALTVIVQTAKDAMLKLVELAELGHTEVLTMDLDGQFVDRARLETEVGAP